MSAEQQTKTPEEYVSIVRTVRETGVSRATIMRWIKAGEVRAKREPEPDGEWRVWLPDAVAKSLGEPPATADEDEPSDDPKYAAQNIYLQTIGALRVANKQVVTLLEPATKLIGMLSAESAARLERIASLEAKLEGMVDKYESQMEAEHKRRMEEDRLRREQDRLDRVFRSLVDFAPAVGMGLAGHFGLGPVQEGLLTKMLANLTDEQFGMMASALRPEQLATLERLRKTHKPPPSAEKEKADGRAA